MEGKGFLIATIYQPGPEFDQVWGENGLLKTNKGFLEEKKDAGFLFVI
jgi:hypothetical protein